MSSASAAPTSQSNGNRMILDLGCQPGCGCETTSLHGKIIQVNTVRRQVTLKGISHETKQTTFYFLEECPDREMNLFICNDLTQHLCNE